jgi:hypothetical protein
LVEWLAIDYTVAYFAIAEIFHRYATTRNLYYTAVELRTGVLAGMETPVLNQSEV